MSNYTELKEIVFDLAAAKELQGKIYLAGGIVPYILAGIDSNREHGDIDFVVKKEDMPIIRQYLKKNNLYQEKYDSLTFDYNSESEDYGIEAFIRRVPVNFAPFEVLTNKIIQRNFLLEEFSGFDALAVVIIEPIKEEDYITTCYLDQIPVGTYTVEMVRATKESTNSEKDLIDLRVLDTVGYNQERYQRIKPALEKMEMHFIPR